MLKLQGFILREFSQDIIFAQNNLLGKPSATFFMEP